MESEIRMVVEDDNPALAAIIRGGLMEFGADRPGFAFTDPEVDSIFETYQAPRSAYFVALRNGRLLGGGGIAPLRGGSSHTCELQKMYLLPEARGHGLGAALLKHCLDAAMAHGFQQCYLETLDRMHAARNLYRRFGFSALSEPAGATGHNKCNTWMMKDLTAEV